MTKSNKTYVSLIIIIMFTVMVFSGCLNSGNKESNGSNSVSNSDIQVKINGGADYSSIQNAVDNANSGDVIFVYNGYYNEEVYIDKPLTIIGESNQNTIVDSGGSDNDRIIQPLYSHNDFSFYVNSSAVTIKNFKLESYDNNITSIGVESLKDDILISGNRIEQVGTGVQIDEGTSIEIKNNYIQDCEYGGIYMFKPVNNVIISGNHVVNCQNAVDSFLAKNVMVYKNTFDSNQDLVDNMIGENIVLYENNFLNYQQDRYTDEEEVIWYNETSKKGNYWDDYSGSDSNLDGVIDSAYLTEYFEDLYPLSNPVNI